jgi:hypothetical protein
MMPGTGGNVAPGGCRCQQNSVFRCVTNIANPPIEKAGQGRFFCEAASYRCRRSEPLDESIEIDQDGAVTAGRPPVRAPIASAAGSGATVFAMAIPAS